MKTLVLEFDDLHWKSPENCLDAIVKYTSIFPTIKLSMFTTARHSGLRLSDNKEWCSEISDFIKSNNLRLAVHGYHHTQEEFKNKSYADARNLLNAAAHEFTQAGLPFAKVFRGPHWGINQATYDALYDFGYTHVYTHEDYAALTSSNTKKIKNVVYNWNLKDSAPARIDELIGHGHTHNVCGNGIEETFKRVCDFIEKENPIFKFVDEVDANV